ncbi:hypothetical protein HPB51_005413 [Rhipicephalus microplus]|uniref:Cytochrome n=1 Tax=Rhipicephalus microplus TaxID=6941 RepID=A0A9J6DYW8_RHIMP|nr:hypothetical protein HPB51_005413 [Rhipicephalus microplus]
MMTLKIILQIQREIDEVIGRERPPKWEDRLHMPFTMASVWEMDRWKTSTPLGVPREASEDTIVDDFFIPKGTVIMANFWAAHFDVNFWKDPEKFDPTRFLNDDGTLMTRKPECLLPFSFATGSPRSSSPPQSSWHQHQQDPAGMRHVFVRSGNEEKEDS